MFDSGCSVAVTPNIQVFIKPPTTVQKTMNGLSSVTSVEGEGMVEWNFLNYYGISQIIKVRTFNVPASRVRLFSPQEYFKTTQAGSFTLNADVYNFQFDNKSTLTFNYSVDTGLPVAQATKPERWDNKGLIGYLCTSSSRKLNISNTQEEILLWHNILGHYDIRKIQIIIRTAATEFESKTRPKIVVAS